MKKIKLIPIILLSALILSALTPALADASDEPAAPELLSGAAVIAEAGSGRVLYELGGSERRYPASITKEMTVLLAVEAIERGEASLGDAVTAGPETLEGMSPDGSTEEVKEGETMSLGDLLYCAMLSSANEVCNVIAVHISGSIESFVAEMNERAAAIGCEDTHFANTHGLHDEDHYSTAYDLMLITRECMTHELFLEIASTTRYTVPATNISGERSLSNTNGLINPETRAYPGYFYEYARAGKTGHTNEAGFCLASMAEREGVELVCVVLGGRAEANSDGSTAYTNFSDSRTLYNWVFSNFSMQEVLSTTEIVTGVTVNLAEDGGQAMLRPQAAIEALLPNVGFDADALERSVVIFSERDGETLTAPIASGTVLGEITVSLDGAALGTSSLVTSGTVNLARTEFMKMEIAGFFGNLWVQLIVAALIAAVALYIYSVVRYRKLHKRHLRSLAEARERAAEAAPAAHGPAASTAAPTAAKAPAEEPTTVLRTTGSGRSVRHPAEDEKTTVLSGVGRRSAAPDGAERPAQPKVSQRPVPPTGDKARRDYFEEFFRSKGGQNGENKDNK